MRFAMTWRESPPAIKLDKPFAELLEVGEPISRLAQHADPAQILVGTQSGRLLLWNAEISQVTAEVEGHSGPVTDWVVLPDGSQTISASLDGRIRVWNETWERQREFVADCPINAVALAPDRRTLAGGGDDGKLRVWDLRTGQLLHVLENHAGITACRFRSVGLLLAGGTDGSLSAWDVDARRRFKAFEAHSKRVVRILLESKHAWYLTAARDGQAIVWNWQHKPRFAFPLAPQGIVAAALSADEQRLVAVHEEGLIRLFGIGAGRVEDEFILADVAGTSLTDALFLADDSQLVLAGADGRLRGVDRVELRRQRYVNQHGGEAYAARYTPDNLAVISTGQDGTLKVWNRAARAEESHLAAHSAGLTALAVAPDNATWAIGGEDGTLRIWNVAAGSFDAVLRAHANSITCLKYLPLGPYLVSGSWDMRLKLWSLETTLPEISFEGHTKPVTDCDVTLDGRRLISVSHDATARVWDLANRRRGLGHELLLLEIPNARMMCCAARPDGVEVAIGHADGALGFWNIQQVQKPRLTAGHESAVSSCQFTPDGRLLFSSDRDGAIRVWNVADGTLIYEARSSAPILKLAIAPDGLQMVGAGQDGLLCFMDLAYEQGPFWTAPLTVMRSASLFRWGAPPTESHDAVCAYCGHAEPVKPKQLGGPWKCSKCRRDFMLCQLGIPAPREPETVAT